MNAHPQFAEALALYAMGALDNPQDLAALESHLGTCGDCRRELEALRADTALLALSATGPQPPARSRQRLLSAIAAEPRVERRTPQRYAVGRLRPHWVTFSAHIDHAVACCLQHFVVARSSQYPPNAQAYARTVGTSPV